MKERPKFHPDWFAFAAPNHIRSAAREDLDALARRAGLKKPKVMRALGLRPGPVSEQTRERTDRAIAAAEQRLAEIEAEMSPVGDAWETWLREELAALPILRPEPSRAPWFYLADWRGDVERRVRATTTTNVRWPLRLAPANALARRGWPGADAGQIGPHVVVTTLLPAAARQMATLLTMLFNERFWRNDAP